MRVLLKARLDTAAAAFRVGFVQALATFNKERAWCVPLMKSVKEDDAETRMSLLPTS